MELSFQSKLPPVKQQKKLNSGFALFVPSVLVLVWHIWWHGRVLKVLKSADTFTPPAGKNSKVVCFELY